MNEIKRRGIDYEEVKEISEGNPIFNSVVYFI